MNRTKPISLRHHIICGYENICRLLSLFSLLLPLPSLYLFTFRSIEFVPFAHFMCPKTHKRIRLGIAEQYRFAFWCYHFFSPLFTYLHRTTFAVHTLWIFTQEALTRNVFWAYHKGWKYHIKLYMEMCENVFFFSLSLPGDTNRKMAVCVHKNSIPFICP